MYITKYIKSSAHHIIISSLERYNSLITNYLISRMLKRISKILQGNRMKLLTRMPELNLSMQAGYDQDDMIHYLRYYTTPMIDEAANGSVFGCNSCKPKLFYKKFRRINDHHIVADLGDGRDVKYSVILYGNKILNQVLEAMSGPGGFIVSIPLDNAICDCGSGFKQLLFIAGDVNLVPSDIYYDRVLN